MDKDLPTPSGLYEGTQAYTKGLRDSNELLRKHLREATVDIDYPTNASVVIQGSHGRRESIIYDLTVTSPTSPAHNTLELTVYNDGRDVTNYVTDLESAVHSTVGTNYKLFTQNVTGTAVSDFDNNPNKTFPGRALQALPLHGQSGITVYAKTKVRDEYQREKRIRKSVNNRLRNARKATETGIQQWKQGDILHFDRASGEVYFGPNHMAFKQGPLRLTQWMLTKIELRDVEYAHSIPNNIVEKLQRFADTKHIGEKEAHDLAEAYQFFLHETHRSHDTFYRSGEPKRIIQPEQLAHHLDTMLTAVSRLNK